MAKYRGSILGPFWITFSMGVMVLGIGLLYARLFKVDTLEFLPYVAIGLVIWGMISSMIIEGCDTFIHASGMLRQTALPMFTFTWRGVFRNLITLAHHSVIAVVVLIWSHKWSLSNVPLAAAGLLLVIANVSWISMFVGIASARFRDVPQIVASLVQFSMFLTPVFWQASQVSDRHVVLYLNPFYYMLDAVRSPLLGAEPDGLTFIVLPLLALAGWAATTFVFTLTRRRIVHYL